jgi:hypothetical protein
LLQYAAADVLLGVYDLWSTGVTLTVSRAYFTLS